METKYHKNHSYKKKISDRTENFKRNEKLEKFLKEMSLLLNPVQKQISKGFRQPKWPVIFIVGNPRSGSTLLTQILAASQFFAVPTNLLSRFYYAPAIGAKIQRLLTDPTLNFKNELMYFKSENNFQSDLGKTKGALEPNEFYHFWRRFLSNKTIRPLSKKEQEECNLQEMVAEIASIENEFNKPFACKGMMLQYNLPVILNAFQNPLIIYIKRNPFYIMQSILKCREKFFGSRETWWSVQPEQFEELKKMNFYKQIAGQVYYTSKSVEEGLKKFSEQHKLIFNYEDFCANPKFYLLEIEKKYNETDKTFEFSTFKIPNIRNMNTLLLDRQDAEKLIDAYRHFSGKYVTT